MFELEKIENMPDKCLVFGYGSLMFPKGINGRGLKHIYTDHNELRPYMLEGFKRTMSAEWTDKRLRFYGLAKNGACGTFGVLIPIHSQHDLGALLLNEAATPVWPHKYGRMYSTWDITDMVDKDARGDLPVFTLVCAEREEKPEWHAPGYTNFVFRHLPKLYRTPFLATGGIKA